MCWSAIASPGTSPCVAADAAPSATAPIAAPMAAAIPRDIIRHLHLRSGCRRVRPLWYGHRRYKFGFAARHPEWPLELFLRFGGQLVPPVVALLEELLLGHLVQERVDGTRGRPPPALRHRLDLVHDLCAVLRRVREDRNDPRAQTSAAVHHPAKRGKHVLRKSYRITDIYPLPLESLFRYRKSDIPKYGPRHRPRGGIHHGKHASGS